MSQTAQIKKALIIHMSERKLSVHIGAARHEDTYVIGQPPGAETHSTPDSKTLWVLIRKLPSNHSYNT